MIVDGHMAAHSHHSHGWKSQWRRTMSAVWTGWQRMVKYGSAAEINYGAAAWWWRQRSDCSAALEEKLPCDQVMEDRGEVEDGWRCFHFVSWWKANPIIILLPLRILPKIGGYCSNFWRVFWEGLEIGLRLHSSEFYSHPNPNCTTYHDTTTSPT